MYYNLAGAYDSNIALILSYGKNREHNLERLSEILRRSEIRGDDLETNIPVQYGLINWILGVEPMIKPNTRFLTHYLAAVGSLRVIAQDVDLGIAAGQLMANAPNDDARNVIRAKETLLLRPVARLLKDAHALAGFIGRYRGQFWSETDGEFAFKINPLRVLKTLYHYLHMDFMPGRPPSEMIWEHDHEVLQGALAFYSEIARLSRVDHWPETQALLAGPECETVAPGNPNLWARCQAAHAGYQTGLELLLVIARIGQRSGFSDVRVDDTFEPIFPGQYTDPEIAAPLIRSLAPPPKASSNEIVTPMGGAFYAREAPHLPVLVEEGMHFEVGQPLFVIEVMKMFNKITAPFSGTMTRCLIENTEGSIVTKGQKIFEIVPDEVVIEESEDEIQKRQKDTTLALLV
jgi:biotin carboxyl carrier protein